MLTFVGHAGSPGFVNVFILKSLVFLVNQDASKQKTKGQGETTKIVVSSPVDFPKKLPQLSRGSSTLRQFRSANEENDLTRCVVTQEQSASCATLWPKTWDLMFFVCVVSLGWWTFQRASVRSWVTSPRANRVTTASPWASDISDLFRQSVNGLVGHVCITVNYLVTLYETGKARNAFFNFNHLLLWLSLRTSGWRIWSRMHHADWSTFISDARWSCSVVIQDDQLEWWVSIGNGPGLHQLAWPSMAEHVGHV